VSPGKNQKKHAAEVKGVFMRGRLDSHVTLRPGRQGQNENSWSFGVQIFATDLDRDAIEKARQGVFPANIAADVSRERLRRFFAKEDRGYRVRNEIREMVIFAPQNLIVDPPFTKLDLLSCRNLLIYLTPEVQKKLIPLFHYSLSPGGILFLGSAETVGGGHDLFVPLSGKSRLFRRRESGLRLERVDLPSSFSAGPPTGPDARAAAKPPLSLQSLADQLVLQRYAPPAVLTNDKGDIFYVSGRTGKYLEPAAGKANWNLFAMAREGLRYELAGAFQEALRKKESVALHGLKVGTNGGEQRVDVTIQRLEEPGALQGLVMIVFTDVAAAPEGAKAAGRPPKPHAPSTRLTELEQELLQVRGEARATHEEMQTSQEELRSANEELQSTNEELQSTNEELTTSKEEMQSMNEELQTLNTELQAKVDELSRASDDMKNLLDSTDIATLFLDNDLNVRRFTPQATKIIKLIPADVGRPITDLASELRYPELAEDVREVLRTLAPAEKPIGAGDGRWFTVRLMPYRTLDDRIDGVVITFGDITAAKTLEAKLRAKSAGSEKRIRVRDD
jgi:PAS domain-containing protein